MEAVCLTSVGVLSSQIFSFLSGFHFESVILGTLIYGVHRVTKEEGQDTWHIVTSDFLQCLCWSLKLAVLGNGLLVCCLVFLVCATGHVGS